MARARRLNSCFPSGGSGRITHYVVRPPDGDTGESGVVPFVMNQREFAGDAILGVNPRGPVDRTMPLLKVASADGKVRAVVFGAATHNTTLADPRHPAVAPDVRACSPKAGGGAGCRGHGV